MPSRCSGFIFCCYALIFVAEMAGPSIPTNNLVSGTVSINIVEQMPHTLVTSILSVDAVELTHAFRQIAVRRLNQQVVVVIHQAPGMAYPVEVGNDLLQDRQKHLPNRRKGQTCMSPPAKPGVYLKEIKYCVPRIP